MYPSSCSSSSYASNGPKCNCVFILRGSIECDTREVEEKKRGIGGVSVQLFQSVQKVTIFQKTYCASVGRQN